jgi:hypothetical protein
MWLTPGAREGIHIQARIALIRSPYDDGEATQAPRDFSQAAKLVVDIAAGQVEDRPPTRYSISLIVCQFDQTLAAAMSTV